MDNQLNDAQFMFADLKIGNGKVNRKGFRIVKEPKEDIVLVDIEN